MTEKLAYFDMEAQKFTFREEGNAHIYFCDELQSIRQEIWSDDGYITFKHEKIEDSIEYFKRKLTGK